MHLCCLVLHELNLLFCGDCVPPDAVEDSVKTSDPSNGSVLNRSPNKGDNDEEEGVKQAFITLPSENTSSQKSSILQVFKKVPLYFPSQSIRKHHSLWFVLDVITVVYYRHLSRSGLWRSV